MSTEELYQIDVIKTLGSPFAVSTEEGEILHDQILTFFTKGQKVQINFKGVEIIVSTYLNAAIGQLYGEFEIEFIQNHLSIQNMQNDDLNILKKVTDTAKQYFSNQQGLENLIKKHFSNGE